MAQSEFISRLSNRLFGGGLLGGPTEPAAPGAPPASPAPMDSARAAAGQQAWMNAAAALLRAKDDPFTSFGGALGSALQAGQQGYQGGLFNAAQREVLGSRANAYDAAAKANTAKTAAEVAKQQQFRQILSGANGGGAATGAGGPDLNNPDVLENIGNRLMLAGQAVAGKRYIDAAVKLRGPKPSATQQEIQGLIARGVPQAWAEDVANGNVSTNIDQFGNVLAVNRATGEVRTLRGAGAPQGTVTVGPVQPAEGGGVLADIDEGTGPFSAVRSLINNTYGALVEGTPFPETAAAKTSLRLFNQTAKTALIQNGRFPVYEQKLIQGMLPDPDAIVTDPDAQRQRLLTLRSHLTNKLEQNQQSMASGGITQKELGDLANQNAAIERVMGLMGPMPSAAAAPTSPPAASTDISSMTLQQLQGVDMQSLSTEDLQKAAARWDELNNGR